jgi:hypothetical protein
MTDPAVKDIIRTEPRRRGLVLGKDIDNRFGETLS